MKPNVFKTRKRLLQNQTAYAIADGYPVTVGHTLVVPVRDGATLFNLTDEELRDCFELILASALAVESDGFNVGVNQGEAAGQTVGQLHFHVIPRRMGDVPNPRGGVRGIIPGKADYIGAPSLSDGSASYDIGLKAQREWRVRRGIYPPVNADERRQAAEGPRDFHQLDCVRAEQSEIKNEGTAS